LYSGSTPRGGRPGPARQPSRRRAASQAFAAADDVPAGRVAGCLVLDVLDGGQTGFDAGFALPGRHSLDAKWYIGNELVAYGRKPADYDPAAFQGIHARYVLVIIDEAGGVPKAI
jgi:hypothetical protein